MQITTFSSNKLRALKEGDSAIFLNDKPTVADSIGRAFTRNGGACATRQGLLVLDINSPISVVYVECLEPLQAKGKPGKKPSDNLAKNKG